MGSDESRLIACLSQMHPDVREAFLNVLEYMSIHGGQRLRPDQVVALVNTELTDIIFDRHAAAVGSERKP